MIGFIGSVELFCHQLAKKKKETLFLFACLAQIRVRRLTSSLADGELVQDFTPAVEQRLKVMFHVL